MRPFPFSRVGFFTDSLVEGVHDPPWGEFPCAQASVATGDAHGRGKEEEPLLRDFPASQAGFCAKKDWSPDGQYPEFCVETDRKASKAR